MSRATLISLFSKYERKRTHFEMKEIQREKRTEIEWERWKWFSNHTLQMKWNSVWRDCKHNKSSGTHTHIYTCPYTSIHTQNSHKHTVSLKHQRASLRCLYFETFCQRGGLELVDSSVKLELCCPRNSVKHHVLSLFSQCACSEHIDTSVIPASMCARGTKKETHKKNSSKALLEI